MGFWESLSVEIIGGITSGLTTGLVVGWLLWRFQRGVEQRRQRQQAEGQIAAFTRDLTRLQAMPNTRRFDRGALHASTSVGLEMMKLLDQQPIVVWRETLPERADLFRAMDDAEAAYSEFEAASARLDNALGVVASRHNPPDGHPLNIARYQTFLLARIDGLSPEESAEQVGNLSRANAHDWDQRFADGLQEPEISAGTESFRAAKQRFIASLNRLETALQPAQI
ncbi:MAG: hypothetical protein ACRDJE_04630 [Dehalococcoidia bacterium]